MMLAIPPRMLWAVAFAGFVPLIGALPNAVIASTASETLAPETLAPETPALCRSAAQKAAHDTGVPLPVLLAITLTETGRKTGGVLQPWPWAINQDGKGHWFSTPEDAVQFAESQLDLGLRNFDVGCFQVNHRWHSKGFRSTEDMFDPASNALYAARFLADLYTEYGDWSLAAAAYHSRTPEFANRYRAKFDTILAGLSDQPLPPDAPQPLVPRVNRFPLLQAGLRGSSASLVPLGEGGMRLIGAQP